MATKLEIINRALIKLGERPITSSSDATGGAIRMATLFPYSVNHVANTYSWSEFIIERDITGSLNINEPVMVDGVARRVIKVLEGSTASLYQIQGGIVSSVSSSGGTVSARQLLKLRLLLQPLTQLDTQTYGPLFSDVVTSRLVYDAAGGRTSILNLLREEYNSTLATCITQDGQQGTNMNVVAYNYPIISDRD